jgi:hypothetical protein
VPVQTDYFVAIFFHILILYDVVHRYVKLFLFQIYTQLIIPFSSLQISLISCAKFIDVLDNLLTFLLNRIATLIRHTFLVFLLYTI